MPKWLNLNKGNPNKKRKYKFKTERSRIYPNSPIIAILTVIFDSCKQYYLYNKIRFSNDRGL